MTDDSSRLRLNVACAVSTLPDLSSARTNAGHWRLAWGETPPTPFTLAPVVHGGADRCAFDVVETYARGDDFVVTHQPTAEFPFRSQLYWRTAPLAEPNAVVVLVTFSLQTDLLDAQPVTQLACEAASHVVLDGQAVQTLDGRMTVMPLEVDRAECESMADSAGGVIRFAPPFLEKGVIRRARFAAVLNAEPISDDQLDEIASQAADQPLPLTT